MLTSVKYAVEPGEKAKRMITQYGRLRAREIACRNWSQTRDPEREKFWLAVERTIEILSQAEHGH